MKRTPFPHPDPWLLAVWQVRVAGSPDTGRLELLLRPCLGGTPQKAKRQGLQREACWEDWGLEMLPSLASLDLDNAGWSHSLGQENPDPASLGTYGKLVSPECAPTTVSPQTDSPLRVSLTLYPQPSTPHLVGRQPCPWPATSGHRCFGVRVEALLPIGCRISPQS